MARHPHLYRSWARFGNRVRLRSSLLPGDCELLILRVGWRRQAVYAFTHHITAPRAVGIGDDEIERAKEGPDAPFVVLGPPPPLYAERRRIFSRRRFRTMSQGAAQAYLSVSAVIFGLIAVIHFARAIRGWGLVIGPLTIPLWESWTASIAATALCVWAIRLATM